MQAKATTDMSHPDLGYLLPGLFNPSSLLSANTGMSSCPFPLVLVLDICPEIQTTGRVCKTVPKLWEIGQTYHGLAGRTSEADSQQPSREVASIPRVKRDWSDLYLSQIQILFYIKSNLLTLIDWVWIP